MRLLVCSLSLFLVGCNPADSSSGQGAPAPQQSPTTPSATPAAPAQPGLAPDALTVEELAPHLPRIDGARVLKAPHLIGPAVIYEACLEDTSAMHAASGVMEKLLGAGWESKPPRQTADPEVVAIDARKRPYLARVTLTHGTGAASPSGSSAPAAGAASPAQASECHLTTQVKLSYFISKSDASFGRR